MALVGMSPGVIATIVIVAIIALVLVVFYFVCRSDDPARDHTCVALLYPRTRRELQQLRIPLDPVNPTDIGANSGFEPDSEENTKRNEHSVQVHSTAQPEGHTDTKDTHCVVPVEKDKGAELGQTELTPNNTTEMTARSEDTFKGFDTVELKPDTAE